MTRTLPKTVLVVPCYNEAGRLSADAFVRAISSQPWLHLLFVDDGSRDDTLAVLELLRSRGRSQISVLALPANGGKAAAVREGMLAALDSDAALVGYWDADLATPLDELRPMCEALLVGGAYMVLGSRVKLLGRHIERRPARHYLGRLFATCASLVLDLPVYDSQCGAKVLRADARARSLFAQPFATRWAFDIEVLARLVVLVGSAREAEKMLVEYPLQSWVDVGGSKLGHLDVARIGVELMRVAALYTVGSRLAAIMRWLPTR